MNKKAIVISAAVILLVGGAAAIASYITRESLQPETVATAHKPAPKVQHQKIAAAAPQQPSCDDKNIVGTVAGGAAGGLVGSQVGKGKGNTAAIIGGVAGGAILGNQYIPTRNITCPK